MKRLVILCCLCGMLHGELLAQLRFHDSFWQPADTFQRPRSVLVHCSMGIGYGLSMFALGKAWYANEDLVSFHFFDDSHQWKQMDKLGHAYSTFFTSNWFSALHRWSGMDRWKAMWLGAAEGFVAVSSIELFDAYGESWGFSWSDVFANASGAGLSILNESLWQETRLMLKWNYLPSPYVYDPDFERLFGRTFPEWMLKDYNGQSYWLSLKVDPFLPEGRFKDSYPDWLNIAVGYSAFGLEGSYEDPAGSWTTREYRQYYISLDLDLSEIHTRSAFLNVLLHTLNYVRIPLPAFQINRNGLGLVGLR